MKNLVTARVIKINRGQFIVKYAESELSAIMSGKMRYEESYPPIGAYVRIEESGQGEAVIHEILERKSYLSRPNSNGHADGFVKTILEQAMVANIDYLFIITSLNDDFSPNRIARFAATSITGNCKPVIILTKADLCENKEDFIARVREINSSIDVICVSSYTGEGIDKVKKYLTPGITVALMGSSGVGKSTLVNTIAGKEVMKVSEIREKDSKGRHTTTHREMIEIDGTFIVDTPGMRELGISDVEEGLNETFDDIVELATHCKFSDCTHKNEPGCAINKAISDGTLSAERWDLYKALLRESNRGKNMALKKKIAIQKKKLGK